MPRYDRPVCGMFFWDDFRSDPVVRRMESAARGIYISLLCAAWNEYPPATLPTDPVILARLGEADSLEQLQSLWPQLEKAFDVQGERLVQKRLKATWDKANTSLLENRARQARWKENNNSQKINKKTANRLKTVSKPLRRRFSSGSGSGSGNNTSLSSGNSSLILSSLDQQKPKIRKDRGSLEELQAYAVELGMPASDGAERFNHWEANGWVNGRTKIPIKNWRAAIRTAKDNGYLLSQKGSLFEREGQGPPKTKSDAIRDNIQEWVDGRFKH